MVARKRNSYQKLKQKKAAKKEDLVDKPAEEE